MGRSGADWGRGDRGDSYVLMVEAVDKAEKAEQRWAGRSGAEWGRLGAG